MDAFFTKDELAQRWKCTTRAIDEKVKAGIIKPSKKIPGWKVPVEQVLKAEESEFNPLSPFERRRMEKEIQNQKSEIDYLKGLVNKLTATSLEVMADIKRREA